jgi:hypothetical protein
MDVSERIVVDSGQTGYACELELRYAFQASFL